MWCFVGSNEAQIELIIFGTVVALCQEYGESSHLVTGFSRFATWHLHRRKNPPVLKERRSYN